MCDADHKVVQSWRYTSQVREFDLSRRSRSDNLHLGGSLAVEIQSRVVTCTRVGNRFNFVNQLLGINYITWSHCRGKKSFVRLIRRCFYTDYFTVTREGQTRQHVFYEVNSEGGQGQLAVIIKLQAAAF